MSQHWIHEIKDNAGGVLRRLHRLLDPLRHFGGGSALSMSVVPSSDTPGAIRYRGSAWLISGATLRVWSALMIPDPFTPLSFRI